MAPAQQPDKGVDALDAESSYIVGTSALVPPADVPEEIFRAALRAYMAPERLDMQALAAELGIGRTTLYRKTGHRDRLLGEVLWYLARRLMAQALDTPPRVRGSARVTAVAKRFIELPRGEPHRRFLSEEPEAALRLLTTKASPVQAGVVGMIERLIEVEEKRGAVAISIGREKLAYAIVRLCETFLYADLIADVEPDVDAAVELIDALLAGLTQPLRAHRRTTRR